MTYLMLAHFVKTDETDFFHVRYLIFFMVFLFSDGETVFETECLTKKIN